MTTIPPSTTSDRVRLAVRAALEVCHHPSWREWAIEWLSGAHDEPHVEVFCASVAEVEALVWNRNMDWEDPDEPAALSAEAAAGAVRWEAILSHQWAERWGEPYDPDDLAEQAICWAVEAAARSGRVLDLSALAEG